LGILLDSSGLDSYHGDYINTINKYELFLKINNKCELIDFKR
jgi:hypothetical protein